MLYTTNMETRFYSHVKKTPDCWLWIGAKDEKGYGLFRVDSRRIERSHRVAYRISGREIPSGKIVCHRCDNPPCVNPSHLWLGSIQENTKDMMSKNRQAKCENQSRAKLTNKQVLEIRALYKNSNPGYRKHKKIPYKNTAILYGVSDCTIEGIVNNRYWFL